MTDKQPPVFHCPHCGAPVTKRDTVINGNDTCKNGCVYPSKHSICLPLFPSVRS